MSEITLIQQLNNQKCDCKKEIFATHIKYYYTEGLNIPTGYIPYQPTSTLDNRYPGGNASNVYLHCILPILNGSQTPISYGGLLNDYFANPQPGIIFTDIATIQAMTNASALDLGLTTSDFIYTVINNQPYWFLSPNAVAVLPNPTYLHIYFGQSNTHNSYDEKADVTVIANISYSGTTQCIPIQEIKEKDSCTGLETYRYVVEDGLGNLINASTVINGFNESNVVNQCPNYPIFEKEICGTIDASVDNYELIKVYTRNPTTREIVDFHYETKSGTVITGDVIEVCCDCNSLCDVPTTNTNKVGFGYATLFNGRDVLGDRITGGEEIYIDYLEVDGNVLINSPLLIGTTSSGFTSTDMGYGISYNKIIDALNTNSSLSSNGVRFVTASSPYAPNPASYDPMCWGVEYDDTKDVRIVLRDKLLVNGASHSFSIRLNADVNQTYDALFNVYVDAGNNWDSSSWGFGGWKLLQNITTI